MEIKPGWENKGKLLPIPGNINADNTPMVIIFDQDGIVEETKLSDFLRDSNIKLDNWILFSSLPNSFYIRLDIITKNGKVDYEIILYRLNSDITVEKITKEADFLLFEIFFLHSNYLLKSFKLSR